MVYLLHFWWHQRVVSIVSLHRGFFGIVLDVFVEVRLLTLI